MAEYPCTNCPDCDPLTIEQCDTPYTLATGYPLAKVRAVKANGIVVVADADVLGNVAIPDDFGDGDKFFTQYAGTIRIEVLPDLQQEPADCWNVTMTP